MRPQLWKFERRAAAMGYEVVAGVDEVGMGPLAGPVVGGAVVLRGGDRIPGLNDSKLMTADEREQVDQIIRPLAVGTGAKLARDRRIIAYDRRHPGRGFADPKGHATPSPPAAIRRLGPSPIHATSWAPFRVSALAGLQG